MADQTEQLSLDPATTALLVMDCENGILEMLGAETSEPLVERVSGVLQAARAAGAHVIHVVVGFRPGYPEVSPRNQFFAPVRASNRLILGTPQTEVHPKLTPRENEPVVIKHRVSAFSGTDIETILRARDVRTLILTGVSTSGVILSTVRVAADLDYQLVVVQDACGERDPEVHRVLTEKVFPRQAKVVRADEVTHALKSAGPATK